MNIESLTGIAEITGAVVVIISLLYVGLQIRQNNNLAAGAAQRELMNSFQVQLDRIVAAPEVFRRGLSDFDSLSENDKVRFHLIFNGFINHLEQTLRMLERGLETQDNVDMYGAICLVFLQEPGGMQMWEATKDLYFPRSASYIESRLSSNASLPPLVSDGAPWFTLNNETSA